MLLPKSGSISKVGVESFHSFGDVLFNIPLIKAISEHYNSKVTVCTREQYRDGFDNIPWVDGIIPINEMGSGPQLLKDNGYEHVFQITQNIKFNEFRSRSPNHSLIDTPAWTGKELGLPEFDQRPIFLPTDREIERTSSIITGEPTIAIECEARSGQSWANLADFEQIVNKYKDSHRILWLSNIHAPMLSNVDNLLRFTRREVIMCIRAADIFFSVGSGFFCASLALSKQFQPKKIVCLWNDIYKYKNRLNELHWHDDITWINDREELVKLVLE